MRSLRGRLAGSVVTGALSVIGAGFGPGLAGHALVMVEEPGCIYCARWHAEVGPAYANSPEGRFAPLARRTRQDADISFLKDIRYSPTFVLVAGKREVGRIVGYPGADLFWGQLVELLAKAGYPPAPEKSARVEAARACCAVVPVQLH